MIVELLIPEVPGPNAAALLDIAMMTLLGGKQRTKSEYEHLFEAAGFQLEQVIAMPSEACLLEATAIT